MKKVLISLRIDEALLSRINDLTQRERYRTTSSVINTIIEAALYDDNVPQTIDFGQLETGNDILMPISRYEK